MAEGIPALFVAGKYDLSLILTMAKVFAASTVPPPSRALRIFDGQTTVRQV
jgi:hypothetical protein